jgi:hypothetical protein
MNTEKRQAGPLDAAARHFRRGELFAQITKTRFEPLIPDLLHLLECGSEGFETLRVDRKRVQLHAEPDPRQNVGGLRKSAA